MHAFIFGGLLLQIANLDYYFNIATSKPEECDGLLSIES